MADSKPLIDEKKLSCWKLLDDFRRRLAVVQAKATKPATRPGGPERLLLEENYFSLILFGVSGQQSTSGIFAIALASLTKLLRSMEPMRLR